MTEKTESVLEKPPDCLEGCKYTGAPSLDQRTERDRLWLRNLEKAPSLDYDPCRLLRPDDSGARTRTDGKPHKET